MDINEVHEDGLDKTFLLPEYDTLRQSTLAQLPDGQNEYDFQNPLEYQYTQ